MRKNTDDLNNVRFLGSISAGPPAPVGDSRERTLDLNKLVAPHPVSTYYLQVAGDSMIGACIHQGDVIVVDRSVTAAHKKIVVARLGDRYTLKRLWNMYPKMYLRSENPKYQPIEVTNHPDFEIFGVVTFVVHKTQ
jgi:DNA polymerase V